MSAIAYVTDENMIEYHRLCRNHTMLFWRPSGKNRFRDFHKGDLLFFYCRSGRAKRRSFVGYGHYEGIKKLSLNQMWNTYQDQTGYDSKDKLREAIKKVNKNDMIPEKMNCLYLTDVVFFLYPVYPKDINLELPPQLESFTYLSEETTDKLLKKAEHYGIDLWSNDDNHHPEEIFAIDRIRQYMAVNSTKVGNIYGTRAEIQDARKLAKEKCQAPGWELIRGSKTDCIHVTKEKIHLAIPFVYNTNDYQQRLIETTGRAALYMQLAKKMPSDHKLEIEFLGNEIPRELEELVK